MIGLPISRRERTVVVLAVAVVSALSVGNLYSGWYGSWGETARALQVTTLLTYPLLAALSAWLTGAPRRRRYQWMVGTGVSGALRLRILWVTAIAGLGFAGMLPVFVVACVMTGSEADFGSFPGLELLLIATGTVAAIAFGLALASALPPMLAPILATVIVYGGEYLLDTGTPSMEQYAGFVVADQRERTYLEPTPWVLIVQCFLLACLALLFLAAAVRSRSWLFPLAGACLAATPLIMVGSSNYSVSHAALQPVCQEQNDYTLCMTRARAHTMDEVVESIEPAMTMMDSFSGQRLTLAEESIRISTLEERGTVGMVVPFAITSGIDGDSHRVVRDELVVDVTNAVLRGSCGSGRSGGYVAKSATAQDVLQEWVLRELNIPLEGVSYAQIPLSEDFVDWSPVASFRSAWNDASPDARLRWFDQHGGDVLTCDLQGDLTI